MLDGLFTPYSVAATCGGSWCRGMPASWGRLCFDSRLLQPGEVFLALRDARDGHDFVVPARAAGAVAAVVAHEIDVDLPQLVVTDPLGALHDLATAHRGELADCHVVMVTGSNGKSTTKEMLAGILRHWLGHDAVHASTGNRNNQVGLPLAVLDMHAGHEVAVLEAGMNNPGEMTTLGSIAQPDSAVITNAGRAHLGNFTDTTAIAQAKGELLGTLAGDGFAVLNADDPHLGLWAGLAAGKETFTFSLAAAAAATVRRVPGADFTFTFTISCAGEETTLATSLQVPGAHNEANALAAAAAGWRLGAPPASLAAGLAGYTGLPGRQSMHRTANLVLIDDSYNSSPESFAAALDVLAGQPAQRRIVVMGDMLELGTGGPDAHDAAVRDALRKGVDHLLAYGDLSTAAVDRLGDGQAEAFTNHAGLVTRVRELVTGETAVLVKGSRGMHMEEVVRALGGAGR